MRFYSYDTLLICLVLLWSSAILLMILTFNIPNTTANAIALTCVWLIPIMGITKIFEDLEDKEELK